MARGSESLLVISPLLSTRALLPFQASVSLFRQGYKQSHDRCWDFKAVFNGQENTIKQTEHDDRGGIWEREQREICQKKKFILKIVLASTSMPYWKDTSDLYYGLTKTWLSYFIMCSGLHLSNNLLWAQHTKSPACITDVTGFCNQICFGSSNSQTLQPLWTPQATETPHSKLINHEFCCGVLVQFNKHSSPPISHITPRL